MTSTRVSHYNKWCISSYEPQDFGVTDPDDIAWMNARLGPMPWHTQDQPLKMQNTESKKLVKSYISYVKGTRYF